MSLPPALLPMSGDWEAYVDQIYQAYLATVAHANLDFQGVPIKVKFMPMALGKGYGFWHLISEAPSKDNKNEADRIPDLDRCARIHWVSWCITCAGQPGFSWWENQRGRETCVVIWAEQHDFAVVLAKRTTAEGARYCLLKTAYCLKPHRLKSFIAERDAFWQRHKD